MEICKKNPDRVAMRIQRNNKELTWTWRQYEQNIFDFAKAMRHLGVQERTSVNIMGANSPEWTFAYFGGVFYNCISSGVYITNGPEACKFQAEHSDASIIVVDSERNLEKYLKLDLP